jgi:O-antigen/teichoic acid export membrane protein
MPSRQLSNLRIVTALNWSNFAIHLVTSFVLTPFVLHHLGKIGFGMWALIQSFSGYYGLINLGIGTALTATLSRELVEEDLTAFQTTVATALAFFGITSTLLMAVAFGAAVPAARFFGLAENQVSSFALPMLLSASGVAADFFAAIAISCLSAAERHAWIANVSIFKSLFSSFATFLLLAEHPNVLCVSAISAGSAFSQLAILALLARSALPLLHCSVRSARFARLRELLHHGGSSTLLSISNLVRLRIGNIILAKTSGMAAVANYSIATTLVNHMTSLISSSFNPLTSRFSRLNAENNSAGLSLLFARSQFCASALAFGFGSALGLFGEAFLRIWLGRSQPEIHQTLLVLVAIYTVALAQAPGWNLMFALSKHHYMAKVSLFEAPAIVILGWWLSRNFGAVGFAAATALVMLVTKLFVQAPHSARIAGLSLADYLKPLAPPAAVAALLSTGIILAGTREVALRGDLLKLVALVGLYLSVYGVGLFLYARGKDYFPPLPRRLAALAK